MRRIPALAAWLFAGQFVVLDLLLRGARAYAHEPRLIATAIGSVALGGLLVSLATRRMARALLALTAATVLVAQALCFRYYHTPIDVQVAAAALHSWGDVRPVLGEMLPAALASIAGVAACGGALLGVAARRITPAPRRAPLAIAAALGITCGVPLRNATPELRLAGALALVSAPREAAASAAVTVPPLVSSKAEPPSVLFVLTESVRASDYGPETAPEVAALLPQRINLTQLRAVSSYTAVSLSALLTGRTQVGARDELLRAPNLFDFARAVRAQDERLRVAYWSAHSETVFERRDIASAVDAFVTVETLLGRTACDDEPDSGFDRAVAAHFVGHIGDLPSPSLVFLHLFGTHATYFFDEERAPFRPWTREVTWSSMEGLHNAYKNAILEQDRSLASCIRAFVDHVGARPWVVVFTSDHGEAFGEHGAIHHGQNLYDEQIHVPGWIAFGNGALAPAEEARLREAAGAPSTHLDLLPTVLDVLGVFDGLPFAPYRGRLDGRSITRSGGVGAPIPVTNCTGMFPCPLDTWGMLGDGHALHAQPWDSAWRCFDLARNVELPLDGACARLREASHAYFPTLPNRSPNL